MAEVLAWLDDDADLGGHIADEYRANFTKHKVDGTMLMNLEEVDIEETLGVKHSLHRRKVINALEKLREDEFELKWGTGPNDLDEFIATLDSDRIRLVARLKVVFDRVDQDCDGVVSFFELRSAFEEMGRNLSGTELVRTWMTESEKNNGTYSFPEFVAAYGLLYANEDPDVRLTEAQTHFNKEIKLLRDHQGQVTHVKLRSAVERREDEAVAQGRKAAGGGGGGDSSADEGGGKSKPLAERWCDDDGDDDEYSDGDGDKKKSKSKKGAGSDSEDDGRRRRRRRLYSSDEDASDGSRGGGDGVYKGIGGKKMKKKLYGKKDKKTSKLAEESIRSVARLAEVKRSSTASRSITPSRRRR